MSFLLPSYLTGLPAASFVVNNDLRCVGSHNFFSATDDPMESFFIPSTQENPHRFQNPDLL